MSESARAYVEIGDLRLALGGVLLVVCLVLSWLLRLGLGRRLAVATGRMLAQLLLLGLVLEWIFALDRPLPVLALALFMSTVAGLSAVRRTDRRFPGVYWASLVSVAASAFLVTGFAMEGVLHVRPPWQPQYFIPLFGMLLGNALTGISLGLDRFLEGMSKGRDLVETYLCHGATPWQASHHEVRAALRSAMIPTLNSMAVIGIVSLPGMMTGQILAGADPIDAVRYQIMIMFMIAGAVMLATAGVVFTAFRVVLPPKGPPRFDRIRRTG